MKLPNVSDVGGRSVSLEIRDYRVGGCGRVGDDDVFVESRWNRWICGSYLVSSNNNFPTAGIRAVYQAKAQNHKHREIQNSSHSSRPRRLCSVDIAK